MDIWEILGIEETFDKTEIKRAYARKAKLYHPEEHPKEYQRLRSAYRMAVKLAEESKKAMEIDAGVPVGEDETEKPSECFRNTTQELQHACSYDT